MVIPARIRYLVLTVLFVLGSVNFTRTAIEILNNSKRLDSLGDEVSALRGRKSDLEQSVAHEKTDGYIEEMARNDLNMIKPGEKVYVLAQNPDEAGSTVVTAKSADLRTGVLGAFDIKNGNLKAWLGLFL